MDKCKENIKTLQDRWIYLCCRGGIHAARAPCHYRQPYPPPLCRGRACPARNLPDTTACIHRTTNPQHAPCPKIPLKICRKNQKQPLTIVIHIAIISKLSCGGSRGRPFYQQLVRVFWRKLLQKTFRKPLDNQAFLIYNIQAVTGTRQHSRTLKIEQNWNLWNLDRGFGNPR